MRTLKSTWDKQSVTFKIALIFVFFIILVVVVIAALSIERENGFSPRPDIWTAILAAGIIAAVGAGLAVLASRSITHPLRQLTKAAVRMAHGELSHPISVAGNGEVALLARAMEQMRVELQQAHNNLEQEVARQTEKLRQRKAHFRRVVDSISDHIYMSEITAAGEHKNIFLSPHVEKLTGYPIENFERDWEFWSRHVIYPDDHAVTKIQLERLLNEQDSQAEYRLQRADGSLVWVRDSARVEKNPETGSLIIFGVVSDISEQKETERALEKQREFLQQVIDTNPHFIFAKNAAGKFTLANQAFARAYGTTVAELIGKTDADFNPNKELVEYYNQADMRVIETGQELTIPADRVVNIHGEEVWRYTIKRPLFDETGRVTQVLGVATDITHLKRAEEAIARARDEAVQANEFKTRLLANVSHDLRTPLNAILGYSEMLQYGVYGTLTPQQEQTVKTIIASIEALTHMVNQLLDQARLEANSVALTDAPFQPEKLVDQMKQTMRVLAQNKGLTLTTEIDPNLPATLIGDAERIQQILHNLVGNAIKFTGQGNVCVRIFATDTRYWAMEVSDTGPGIPAAARSLIFEPFQQVDGSITREHTGSGLGLSIVKQLTTLMDGQILLQSREGHGSTFTVLLPLTPAQERSE
ncbi:MAG: PAS domain S-box protein [Chloroflexi bacterium]|nr:MAG: PAS domain S-box protein [Chloroflexota bacterium]